MVFAKCMRVLYFIECSFSGKRKSVFNAFLLRLNISMARPWHLNMDWTARTRQFVRVPGLGAGRAACFLGPSVARKGSSEKRAGAMQVSKQVCKQENK